MPPIAAMAIEPPCSDCRAVSKGEVPYAMANRVQPRDQMSTASVRVTPVLTCGGREGGGSCSERVVSQRWSWQSTRIAQGGVSS